MKSIEMADNLEKLLNESQYRSILIDGPWGCGKTYEINKLMKKIDKKCIYISLFGLESIDEINTELYNAGHPKLVKANKVMNVVSKAVSPVKYVGSIADALSFQLNNVDKTKIKKSRIVIFDDLERLSNKIDYKDLVGYINKLFFNELRVICLCSSENIDKKRVDSFQQFKEKVFDCYFSIKETDYEVYDEIFKELNIRNIEFIYPLFENNIRTAKRVCLFYKDLLNYLDYENNQYSLTKYDLLKACAYTVLCVLNSQPKPEINDVYQNVLYEQLVSDYGESIANGAYHYLKMGKEESIGNIHNAVLELISCYIYRDFKAFEKTIRYVNPQDEKVDILDQCPFYLSEENKSIYFGRINEYIDNLVVYNDVTTKRIRDLYYYTKYIFDNVRIEKIASVYFATVKKTYLSKETISEFIFPGINRSNGKISDFISIFSKKYIELYTKRIVDSFYKAVDENEYSEALDSINQLSNFSNEEEIKNMLKNNHFFLVDVEKDISEMKWDFLNSIAAVALRQNLSKEYISSIQNYYNESKCDNETLKTRLISLVRNNIDSNFILKETVN